MGVACSDAARAGSVYTASLVHFSANLELAAFDAAAAARSGPLLAPSATSMPSTQDFLLRTAEPRDFAAMCELLSQLTVLDGPCGPPTRGDWERMLAGAAAREQSIVVAEDAHSGALLGTASLIVEHKLVRGCGRVGHVEDVVTHEKARGRGVGRALLGRLAELAREAGCYKVILDCADKNAAFYEKSGYRRAELQMRLDLGPPQRGARPPAPAPSKRVLSLLSASTEIVCRLGCAHLLVRRSRGCTRGQAVHSVSSRLLPCTGRPLARLRRPSARDGAAGGDRAARRPKRAVAAAGRGGPRAGGGWRPNLPDSLRACAQPPAGRHRHAGAALLFTSLPFSPRLFSSLPFSSRRSNAASAPSLRRTLTRPVWLCPPRHSSPSCRSRSTTCSATL